MQRNNSDLRLKQALPNYSMVLGRQKYIIYIRSLERGGVIKSILSFLAKFALGRCYMTLPIGRNGLTREKDRHRPCH